jgi:hypothetical protein
MTIMTLLFAIVVTAVIVWLGNQPPDRRLPPPILWAL